MNSSVKLFTSLDVARYRGWLFLQDRDSINLFQCNKSSYAECCNDYLLKSNVWYEDWIKIRTNHYHPVFQNLFFVPSSVINFVPATIRSLSIECNESHKFIENSLPPSLTSLNLYNFNQEIQTNVLPNSITFLNLSDDFNHIILPNVLPHSLTRLFLGSRFNQPILPHVLPTSLTSLHLGINFSHPLAPGILPLSLNELEIADDSVLSMIYINDIVKEFPTLKIEFVQEVD